MRLSWAFVLISTSCAIGAATSACDSSLSGGALPSEMPTNAGGGSASTGTQGNGNGGGGDNGGNQNTGTGDNETDAGNVGSNVACASDTAFTASGTITGKSLSQCGNYAQVVADASGVKVIAVHVGSHGYSCAGQQADTKNLQFLGNTTELVMYVQPNSMNVSKAYPITGDAGGGGAQASFQTITDCNSGAQTLATSGSVTITQLFGGTVQGTFDLTFQSGDHVTGSFTSDRCDIQESYSGLGCVP